MQVTLGFGSHENGHHSDEFQPIVNSLRIWLLDGENLAQHQLSLMFPEPFTLPLPENGPNLQYSSVECAVSVYARASLLANM